MVKRCGSAWAEWTMWTITACAVSMALAVSRGQPAETNQPQADAGKLAPPAASAPRRG